MSTPFTFEIRKLLSTNGVCSFNYSSLCCQTAHELPPSLNLRVLEQVTNPVALKPTVMKLSKCKIEYSLVARLIKGGLEILRTSREYLYVPTVFEPSPPLETSDFLNEYWMSTGSPVADWTRLNQYGRLSICVEEPNPLLIDQDKIAASRKLVVSPIFRFYPSSRAFNAEKLKRYDFKCTLTIEQDSFFSLECQGRKLPRKRSLSPYLISKTMSWDSYTCKLRLASWHGETGMSAFPISPYLDNL
jgi:hypothetical protein